MHNGDPEGWEEKKAIPWGTREGTEEGEKMENTESHKFVSSPSNPFISYCVKCGVEVDWYKVREGAEIIPPCRPDEQS